MGPAVMRPDSYNFCVMAGFPPKKTLRESLLE